jgi:hypothetical protein
VAEIKDKESNPDSESDSENTGKGQIIDVDTTAIVATAAIQPEEPTDPEEGEHLFHSQMWVKGTPLHFIVDSGSREEPHLNRGRQTVGIVDNTTPTAIQHRVASPRTRSSVSANNFDCHLASNPSRMRYYVMLPH